MSLDGILTHPHSWAGYMYLLRAGRKRHENLGCRLPMPGRVRYYSLSTRLAGIEIVGAEISISGRVESFRPPSIRTRGRLCVMDSRGRDLASVRSENFVVVKKASPLYIYIYVSYTNIPTLTSLANIIST